MELLLYQLGGSNLTPNIELSAFLTSSCSLAYNPAFSSFSLPFLRTWIMVTTLCPSSAFCHHDKSTLETQPQGGRGDLGSWFSAPSHWFHCSGAVGKQSIVEGLCDRMLTPWQQATESKGPGTRHTLQGHVPRDLPLPTRPYFLRVPPPQQHHQQEPSLQHRGLGRTVKS